MELQSSPPFDPSHTTALLINTVQEVSSASSLQEIMDVVKRTARTGTGADGASFVLREGDLCYYADEDSIAPLWKGRRFPMQECVSGWTMLHRQAAAIPDITLDPRIPQDAYRPTFVRSLVMVPIRSRDPVGAIGVYWGSSRLINSDFVHWLQALADATSAGIEAVRANAEVAALRRASAQPFAGPDGEAESVRMCAWTKRIFHQGQWLSIEAFLHARYGLEVSHGMSEDALGRLKQEMSAVARRSAPEMKAEVACGADARLFAKKGPGCHARRGQRPFD
jgi:hypothetical protein